MMYHRPNCCPIQQRLNSNVWVPLLAKAVEEEVRTRWGAGGMDGILGIVMSMFMLEWLGLHAVNVELEVPGVPKESMDGEDAASSSATMLMLAMDPAVV